MTQTSNDTTRKRRWWVWVLAAYVLALVASWVYQLVSPRSHTDPGPLDGQRSVELPTTTRDGVGEGTMRVAYWDLPGDGVPVILMHGSPGDARALLPLGALLVDDGRRVIAPDLPGFGRSSRIIPDYSARAHAVAMLGLMDELGIERAHVLGWSNGGLVAVHMGDIAPERVASVTMLAATGAQITEGSGSYYFEHAKYALGFVVLGGLPELLPHFGTVAPFGQRMAWLRGFWDTDQRSVERIMRSCEVPTLVLHAHRDMLVPGWAGPIHHEMIPTSSLVMLRVDSLAPMGHFLPFIQPGVIAEELTSFIARHDRPGVRPVRSEIDYQPTGRTWFDTIGGPMLLLVRAQVWWVLIGAIALACRRWPISTVAVVAMLVGAMEIDFGVALVGLLLGACGARRPDRTGRPRTRRGWAVWLAFSLVAVLLFSWFVVEPVRARVGSVALVLGFVPSWLIARLLPMVFTTEGRWRLLAGVQRLFTHEFWGSEVWYIFLAPSIARMALRSRGFLTVTCCNPGIENGGGFIGESKDVTMNDLPGELGHVAPTFLVWPSMVPRVRVDELVGLMSEHESIRAFPVALKPDNLEHGTAFRIARSEDDALEYFDLMTRKAVVQPYIDLPRECAVLWLRHTDGTRTDDGLEGFLYSITRKEPNHVTGDGRRTIRRLIWRDRRLRLQADVFLRRFGVGAMRVPDKGERVRLGHTGNHGQGARFLDGADLITPALTAKIDALMRGYRGNGGAGVDAIRLDLRYESDEQLAKGEGFVIIEINGTTGESVNAYDPSLSLAQRLAIMRGHWEILFEHGRRRRAQGVRPLTWRGLRKLYKKHTWKPSRPITSE